MKKTIILVFLLVVSLIGFAQDFVEGDSLVIYGGGTFENEVQGVEAVNTSSFVILSQLAALSGADSLFFNVGTGLLDYFSEEVLIGSASLDGRYAIGDLANYIPYTDTTTLIVTLSQLIDSLAASTGNSVFHISMPLGSGTVQGRIDVTTDLPDDWILTADGINLIITHGLGRRVFGVTVWGKTGGTVEQELYDTNRYTLIESLDVNTAKIYGLSLFPGEIVVRITFE